MVGIRAGTGQQTAGQPQDKPPPIRLPGWLVVAVPAVAELVVGGYKIAGPSLWRDEAATISGSQRPVGAIMDLTLHQDAVHGAYYLLMHTVIAVGGTSETALRLPSLIAMCLAAGLTAGLGVRLARESGLGLAAARTVGLLAGLALVVVPLTTRYAQEARPYALTTLFAVLASYLLVRAAEGDRWSWWAGYGVAITVTGLFNLFAVLLAVAHGVSLVASRGRAGSAGSGSEERRDGALPGRVLWWWLIACAAAAALLAPLAVLSVRQSAQLSWVTRPDPSTVATLMRDFSGATLLIPVVAAVAVLGCAAGSGLRRGRGLTLAVVALPWLVLPPVLLLAVSIADPVYVERYVVFCLPALSLLAAAGTVWLAELTRQAISRRGVPGSGRPAVGAVLPAVAAVLPAVAVAVLVVAGSIGPQRAIRLPGARADNLRAVAAVLSAHERPGDAILYLQWDASVIGNAYPVAFGRLDNVGLGVSPAASRTLRGLPAGPGVVTARLRRSPRVWTVRWTSSQPSVGAPRTGPLVASGMRLVRSWRIQSVLLSLYARH